MPGGPGALPPPLSAPERDATAPPPTIHSTILVIKNVLSLENDKIFRKIKFEIYLFFFHSWSDSSTVTFQLFIHCIIPLAVSGFFHMPKTYYIYKYLSRDPAC